MSTSTLMKQSLITCALLLLGGCASIEKTQPEKLPKGLKTVVFKRSHDASRELELFWMEPKISKPWPVVIYLHGHTEGEFQGGRVFHAWGALQKASGQGYLAVAVSLPGYGKSSGPRDFMGPDSQEAVADAIRFLRRRGDSKPAKVALVGISHGASLAAKVGEQVAGLAGVVLISGVYDLGEMYTRWKGEKIPEHRALAERFELEAGISAAGPTELAVRERSVLPDPQIRAPTLIFQGGRDLVTSAPQAELLAEKLRSRGVDARAIVYPEEAHNIPVAAREKEIDPFLSKVLLDKPAED